MRLNGWQRVGVVALVLASAAWTILVIVHMERQPNWATMTYDDCVKKATERPADPDLEKASSKCMAGYFKNQDTVREQKQIEFLFLSLVPIGLVWFIAYMALEAVRRVRRGFESSP
jgi:hypothetical protein